MKETNLEKIKVNARMLLYVEPEPIPSLPIMVSHPYFQSQMFLDFNDGKKEVLDISNNADLARARQIIVERIDKAENITQLLMMMNQTYYSAFLKYTYEYMSAKDLAETLQTVWLMTEFPNYDANFKKTEFINLFKTADKKILMTEEDYDFYVRLPETVTVYRGTKYENYKALSWTLSKKEAVWFSERFLSENEKGQVYQAEIDKKDIFAYFNDRNEKEIVLDYRKLKNLKEI